jgi:arginine/serine-rich splicing factor 4/5/6
MRLYVGNLPWDVRTRDLERLFDEFGEIRDIDIHSSFAFVEYYNWRDADDAIYYLDNTRFMGERIRVEEARDRGRAPSPPRRSNYRIVVENLSPSISWQDLKDYFRRAGEIVFADVYRSREEGVCVYMK